MHATVAMQIERERKFLVQGDSWRARAGAGVLHQQCYLTNEGTPSVRIRIAGHEATLTIKGRRNGDARSEFEYPIPVGDAEQLFEHHCVTAAIRKIRYNVEAAGRRFEIDEFQAENLGLTIAELEGQEMPETPPEWLGEEVTHDPRYLNVHLVERPYSTWDRREARNVLSTESR